MTDSVVSTEDRFVTVPDGLKLHVRDWRPAAHRGAPVVCLPGLARTLDDFVLLAERLSAQGRRVIAISARGRGLSERDPDPARYQLKTESEDVLATLDAIGVDAAHVVGTSRGGLHAMTIAALRPSALRSVVLNDIGPVVETEGLKRIREGLARHQAPRDFAHGARLLAMAYAERFPALTAQDFDRWARRAWRSAPTGLEPACDPALMRIFEGVDLDRPTPAIWPVFDLLAGVPLMVVRGEHSDILSAETVRAMTERRPLTVVTTPGQGHAPLLEDEPTMSAIARFLDEADPA
ncbi:alpha/beta fold hydrolase [Chenggangzhangella methanolivorans]|uniref:Alpha/beta hydrolase n=1 Tax=Chenggangzhangella methanolivorans TaxID=1437009 RepID=A0A9E6RFR3_9HYPH|nr:alpha/beta hydrolase [Chenggangzhangella methanolivorans]QZO00127.1 alpha/beta hydrolase [Chenggangzhangella methanolivorans]